MKIKVLFFIIISVFCQRSISQNPPITPVWALGHIVWEDSLNTQDGALELVKSYISNNIPVGGIIIDSPWSTAYNDFQWDLARYPNPLDMIRELTDTKVKTILWTTGTVNLTGKDVPVQKCESYDYVVSNGYGINGSEPTRWWKGEGVHIDFTNVNASCWWKTQLDKVGDFVCGYKVDQAEGYFGDTVTTSIGKMANIDFRKYYYDFMFDYATNKNPNEGMIIARPYSYQGKNVSANISKLSLGWCGDFEGNYDGLINQLKDIYYSSILGYGAVGCEIGGFYGAQATGTQLVRYCQFASMTAAMINGGMNGAFSSHLPWWHNEEITNIYRYYTTLHYELRPYIFSTLVDCHKDSGGLLRNCDIDNICHSLGNDIFCKPIVNEDSIINFVLPENEDWVDFWSRKVIKGGTKISRNYPLKEMPLYIRKGSIMPLSINNSITGLGDSSMKDRVVILIVMSTEKAKQIIHYPTTDGIDYEDIIVEVDPNLNVIDISSNNFFDYTIIIWGDSKEIVKKEASGSHLKIDCTTQTSIKGQNQIKRKINKRKLYSLGGVKMVRTIKKGIFIEEDNGEDGQKVYKKFLNK